MVRSYLMAAAVGALTLSAAAGAQAQDVKIGFILPMTGQQQSTGKRNSEHQQNADQPTGQAPFGAAAAQYGNYAGRF